jgi:hypothetical protein
MDKAIIFGIYNFVSFHACKTLLNKGLEVIGVHIDEIDNNYFLAEKRLEVGRNANYIEQTLSEWENSRNEEMAKTALIFSIYDLFMCNKEAIIQKEKVVESITHYLERNNSETSVVVILPIQMVSSDKSMEMEAFLNQARKWGKHIQMFYVPAIYGPWQSSTFLFQQAILSKFQKTKIIKDEREWTRDILYIDDALEVMFEIMESKGDGSYILESGKKDYWFECAAFLHLNEYTVRSNCHAPLTLDNQFERILVKEITPITDSISKQLEQVQRLFHNGI